MTKEFKNETCEFLESNVKLAKLRVSALASALSKANDKLDAAKSELAYEFPNRAQELRAKASDSTRSRATKKEMASYRRSILRVLMENPGLPAYPRDISVASEVALDKTRRILVDLAKDNSSLVTNVALSRKESLYFWSDSRSDLETKDVIYL